MARPKGQPKLGGRQKGTPNKDTALIRDMITQALFMVGGTAYLARQAEENPSAFLGLVGKVLPMQLAAETDGPITVKIVSFADVEIEQKKPMVIDHDAEEVRH